MMAKSADAVVRFFGSAAHRFLGEKQALALAVPIRTIYDRGKSKGFS